MAGTLLAGCSQNADVVEESTIGNGTYTTYSQSIWIICKKEGDSYKVKEIIPMKLR